MSKAKSNRKNSVRDLVRDGFMAFVHLAGPALRLRHRHVLTRDNKLRLRYAVPFCAVVVSGFLFSAATLWPESTNAAFSSLNKLASYDAGPETKLAATQKRLSRYGDTADTTKEIVAEVEKSIAAPKENLMKVGKGDTMAGVLQKAGIGASEAYKIVMAMEDDYDPRKIRPGQEIKVRLDPVDDEGSDYKFAMMEMVVDPIKTVRLNKDADGAYKSEIVEKEVTKKVYTGKADIEVSLYGSAEKADIPASVIAQTMHIFSWDVDFQRDIRRGDIFEIMYEQFETPEGVRVKSGDVIYARLVVNGADLPVYRYEMANGDVDYFLSNGASVRKALMQTPIDGARLSSGFGMRHHPVLGYNKMHKGVDFAAPRGTPIYAAGDGTIEKAGPYSSYGNYVRIRHNASIKTAYAHMKGFAKGVSTGKRVKQGQVIGYVGTTGRSTGPHLHYEVLKNGHQVNPKTVKLPQGETLTGTELANFKKHIEKLNNQYVALSGKQKFAFLR